MYKFVVGNSTHSETVMASSEDTLRSVFEQAGVEIGSGMVTVDGARIDVGDLDKEVGTFNLRDDIPHSAMSVIKYANACSILIAGNSAVVVSKYKPDELKMVQKYRPAALDLKDEDKNLIYSVRAVKNEKGKLGRLGAEFSARTNADGLATITIELGEGEDKEWFVDNFAGTIANINKIEAQVAGCYDEIVREKEAIADSIMEM